MKTQKQQNDRTITSSQDSSLILADAHVHLHDCFVLDRVLDAALENFSKFGKPEQAAFQGVLFLAEMANQNRFNDLLTSIEGRETKEWAIGNWTIYPTDEKVSLWAKHVSGQDIIILAGRQIITEEGLEVLALITEQQVEDGLSLEQTIQRVLAVNGIPVLPWGVGKWIGRRGRLVKSLLEENNFPILLLGDNGGRPVFWLRSPYFKQAEAIGLQILPGTDPLPLASECCRPGSFGFKTQNSLNLTQPGQAMRRILIDPTTVLETYGPLETPVRFVRNQLAIRL